MLGTLQISFSKVLAQQACSVKGVPLNPLWYHSAHPLRGNHTCIQIKRFLSSSQLMAFLGESASIRPLFPGLHAKQNLLFICISLKWVCFFSYWICIQTPGCQYCLAGLLLVLFFSACNPENMVALTVSTCVEIYRQCINYLFKGPGANGEAEKKHLFH